MTRLYAACIVGVPVLWVLVRGAGSVRARQLLLLGASYAFYLSLGTRFFVVLFGSSLFNFAWGAFVRRRATSGRLWVGVVLNVMLLSAFKYAPALVAVLADASPPASWLADLALPIGISFWTFQALSYLIDQHRGEKLDPTLIEFLLYMAFAPTVLSGPICRLREILPQYRVNRRVPWDNVAEGARSIWVGLLMIAVARLLGSGTSGRGINWGFEQPSALLSTLDVWVLLGGYGFQLFFDFAGYSRVVIGLALAFDIGLPENFQNPFLAGTPSVFWTKWHMSLSSWIRDYLFLPLATARNDIWWRNVTLVLSMVVFGLWHKASFLFVVWGTYQGLVLLAHRLVQQWQRRNRIQASGWAWSGLSWLATFVAMTIGWSMFRSRDWLQAAQLIKTALVPCVSCAAVLPGTLLALVFGVAATYFVIVLLQARIAPGRSILSVLPAELRYVCYAGIAYLTLFRSAEPQSFIYLQF